MARPKLGWEISVYACLPAGAAGPSPHQRAGSGDRGGAPGHYHAGRRRAAHFNAVAHAKIAALFAAEIAGTASARPRV